jgi:hypothetical protein
MLTPAEQQASSAWHLCFRRDIISVNGELGGPRGVTAVDLDEGSMATLEEVKLKTPEGELPRFDALSATALKDPKLTYRGDHIVSAFSGHWLEPSASPPAPAAAAWLVVSADGQSKYLVDFIRFEGTAADTPGTVVMKVKPVQ